MKRNKEEEKKRIILNIIKVKEKKNK